MAGVCGFAAKKEVLNRGAKKIYIEGMSSTTDGGSNGTDIPFLERTLGKLADIPTGGIIAFSVVSSTAITFQSFRNKNKLASSMAQNLKNGKSCDICKGKGFYQCRLCKGNSTIHWSPLYDPVFINPCLCPTCDGNRIQRCLNCLGKGFLSQV